MKKKMNKYGIFQFNDELYEMYNCSKQYLSENERNMINHLIRILNTNSLLFKNSNFSDSVNILKTAIKPREYTIYLIGGGIYKTKSKKRLKKWILSLILNNFNDIYTIEYYRSKIKNQ